MLSRSLVLICIHSGSLGAANSLQSFSGSRAKTSCKRRPQSETTYREGTRILKEQTSDEPGSRGSVQEQYVQLLHEFGGGLARLAASYEAVPQSREDLLQDIRVALWMALPKFRNEASLRTFVYRIAHNRALTHVWRRKYAGVSDPIDELPLMDARPGLEKIAMAAATREQLLWAIRRLPLPLKQVITLALEDMSNVEIGAVLALTDNNVAVRLRRARAVLRERLRRNG
jgi:RNA polymerase sigma factor (sigma-70 family)